MTAKKLDPNERRKQLRRAPRSDAEDAEPRIELSQGTDGSTRVEVADTAVVRPGKDDRGD